MTLPSEAVAAADWERAHRALAETLRDLLRIPSVNPPDPGAPDGELRVARHIADLLTAEGLRPEVIEPVPGRGSVHVRLLGESEAERAGLLLLSHLDVVPAPPEHWTHAPFAGDLVDGYVYGRGAVDMKGMIALELGVVRQLAREAREAGLDPAVDPIPGLKRDVLFTCTADEEAGGGAGAHWIADHRPDWLLADGAVNECGGVSMSVGDHRLYPIQVAEKGYAAYRIAVTGAWGHGSMPRPDNAAVLAARVVERLAEPGPARVTPVMARFLEAAGRALGPREAAVAKAIVGDDLVRAEAAVDALCDPMYARAMRALLRDSVGPDVIHAGVKYNVIPGDAIVEVDCRLLPGTTEADMRAQLLDRLGPELTSVCELTLLAHGEPVEVSADTGLYAILVETLRDHDPDGVPLPALAPFATDAKFTVPLGTPTYGFSPLRLDPDERFLERFHGVDERVSLDALRFGLPVLYDVVRRACG